jgi:uncharacterized protein (DUF1697 family)
MPVIVSLLRGVNVGSHNRIRMEVLREIYESAGLWDVRTYVQSGNVVFRTRERGLAGLAKRIEDAIDQALKFRPDVILRTSSELRDVIARNPFAARSGIDPCKLLVTFLAGHPSPEARAKALEIKADPEEFRIDGREFFMYFPNGMGRPKVTPGLFEKLLNTRGTGRNWNTVTKLLEVAQTLEGSG